MNDAIVTALVGLASRLGRFETSLLTEIDAAGDDAYCAELSRRLSNVHGREVSMGQVSRTLGTLKRLGLLLSEEQFPATPKKNHRRRLVFSLTSSGKATLEALANRSSRDTVSNRPATEGAAAMA